MTAVKKMTIYYVSMNVIMYACTVHGRHIQGVFLPCVQYFCGRFCLQQDNVATEDAKDVSHQYIA